MAKRKTDRPDRKQIEKSMMRQLEAKNADVEHFRDYIYDYLELYDQKLELQAEIRESGTVQRIPNAKGIIVVKKNPATDELRKHEKSMLDMLNALGLTTDEPNGTEKVNGDL